MRVTKLLLVCFVALIFVMGCSKSEQKAVETADAMKSTTETAKTTAESAKEPAAPSVEEVTLSVTGMT